MSKLLLLIIFLLIPLCMMAEEVEESRIGKSSLPPLPEDMTSDSIIQKVLKEQLDDMTTSIGQLLEDYASGARIMKVYKQMKMYNDPTLNPVLYGKK